MRAERGRLAPGFSRDTSFGPSSSERMTWLALSESRVGAGERVAYREDREVGRVGACAGCAAHSSALSTRAHPSHDGLRHCLRRLPVGASSRVLSTGNAVRSRARRHECSAELAPTRGTNNRPSTRARASDPTPSRLPRRRRFARPASPRAAPRTTASPSGARSRSIARPPRARGDTREISSPRPASPLPLDDSSPRSSPLAADPPPEPEPRSNKPPFAPRPPSLR